MGVKKNKRQDMGMGDAKIKNRFSWFSDVELNLLFMSLLHNTRAGSANNPSREQLLKEISNARKELKDQAVDRE